MGRVLVPCGARVSPSLLYGECRGPSVWGWGQPEHPCVEGSWPPVWCEAGVSPSITVWAGSWSLCGAGVSLSPLCMGRLLVPCAVWGCGQSEPPGWAQSWPRCVGLGSARASLCGKGPGPLCGVRLGSTQTSLYGQGPGPLYGVGLGSGPPSLHSMGTSPVGWGWQPALPCCVL